MGSLVDMRPINNSSHIRNVMGSSHEKKGLFYNCTDAEAVRYTCCSNHPGCKSTLSVQSTSSNPGPESADIQASSNTLEALFVNIFFCPFGFQLYKEVPSPRGSKTRGPAPRALRPLGSLGPHRPLRAQHFLMYSSA